MKLTKKWGLSNFLFFQKMNKNGQKRLKISQKWLKKTRKWPKNAFFLRKDFSQNLFNFA